MCSSYLMLAQLLFIHRRGIPCRASCYKVKILLIPQFRYSVFHVLQTPLDTTHCVIVCVNMH